ncbi:MAG: hypothetical protein AAFR96_13475, partial [Planctomycetota bacterium]
MTTEGTADDTSITLSDADRLALDWLLQSEAGPLPASVSQQRVDRLSALVTLSGSMEIEHDPRITSAAVARVQALVETSVDAAVPGLSDADQDAIDTLMISGMAETKVPARLRSRARRLVAAGHAISQQPYEHDSGLTERTLAAVAAARPESERPVAGRIGGKLADLISIAAIVLISASVVWPVVTSVRGNAMRQINQSNLAVAGIGFGAYAADFAGELPRLRGPESRSAWWQVGSPQSRSNSTGLYLLARLDYTPDAALASPGNPNAPEVLPDEADDWQSLEEVSYSYQLQAAGPNRAPAPAVVLADRSPVVPRLLAGEPVGIAE